ncbi:MAG: Gfo/Idh/MocA family oxidoreductase [Acetatifactor sp.]|nr:Gfo/Idh/MocA family oxidoreductase [Acetatifactor sp.]
MKKINMAILGAGNIAGAMAKAISGIPEWVNAYAVAARDLERAQSFAKEWGFAKAYGSYDELVKDPQVDLIYVATPHSHHYEHAKLCLENGKATLVEKAFTANAAQTADLIMISEEKHIFLQEAIWTRFIPAKDIVQKLLEDKVIGEPVSLFGEFSVPIAHVKRLTDPALAGGSLLDLGMYSLTFASMYFGDDIVEVSSKCEKYETGVDATDDIYYTYRDGKTAHLRTSFVSGPFNEGTIEGTKGKIRVETLNNYTAIQVFDTEGKLTAEYPIPPQVNGYEYEVIASVKALQAGEIETKEMTHAETLEIMRQMDALRKEWGVIYPFPGENGTL